MDSKRSFAFVFFFFFIFIFNVAVEVVESQQTQIFSPLSPNVAYYGRVLPDQTTQTVQYDWSGVVFQFGFSQSSVLGLNIQDVGNEYNVFVDDFNVTLITNATNTPVQYILSTELDPTTSHYVFVTKRTEALFGVASLQGIILSEGAAIQTTQSPLFNESRRIEFLGDSITAGYGDLGTPGCSFSAATEDNYLTYGALIARYFNADLHLEAWSGKGLVRNYGYPNVTSPDSMPTYWNKTVANLDAPSTTWDFSSWIPDAFVINLGTNDYSTQPAPPQDIFQPAYIDFISQARLEYGNNFKLFLVCGPFVGFADPYCEYVQNVAEATGSTYLDIQGVLNDSSTDFGCDGHPSVIGHHKMYEAAYPVIQKVMEWF